MNVGLILLWQENHLFNLLKQAKTFPRSQGRSFEDVLFQATHSITTFPAPLYQKEGEDDHKEAMACAHGVSTRNGRGRKLNWHYASGWTTATQCMISVLTGSAHY